MKKVTSTLAKGFICERCVEAMKGLVERAEELTFYKVELVKFLSLGGSEAAETVRTRIGWVKFRECGKFLNGRRPYKFIGVV